MGVNRLKDSQPSGKVEKKKEHAHKRGNGRLRLPIHVWNGLISQHPTSRWIAWVHKVREPLAARPDRAIYAVEDAVFLANELDGHALSRFGGNLFDFSREG